SGPGRCGDATSEGIAGPTVRRWTAPGPGGLPLPGPTFFRYGFRLGRGVPGKHPSLLAHASPVRDAGPSPSNTGVMPRKSRWHDANALGREALPQGAGKGFASTSGGIAIQKVRTTQDAIETRPMTGRTLGSKGIPFPTTFFGLLIVSDKRR